MRWLFHVLRREEPLVLTDGRYHAPSLATEGFIHASYRDAVAESARLYFSEPVDVLAIDPRRLDVPLRIANTPRGPMPHLHGSLPADALRRIALDEVAAHPDVVTGTRIALAGFDGMTLLDLVGPLDVLSRIATMGFDPTTTCEVIALTSGPIWTGAGAVLSAERYRPALDAFDVLVVAGGPRTDALVADTSLSDYLASFPRNRRLASVCTGARLIGAAGHLRGRQATTHASALDELPRWGATPVRARVVDEGNVITAAGVVAGIDLALHLVERLVGREARAAIASRIELAV